MVHVKGVSVQPLFMGRRPVGQEVHGLARCCSSSILVDQEVHGLARCCSSSEDKLMDEPDGVAHREGIYYLSSLAESRLMD